jgi:hydrogenase maturation protease
MINNQILIIAYGNRLRGDDGVGPAAGDVVRSWQLPGVNVLTVRQLLPELIEEMTDAARILFVDAAINPRDRPFAISVVEPGKSRRPWSHYHTPANLLALLSDLEDRTPEAWLLTISAISFDHGEQLTEIALDNVRTAVAWIHNWLAEQTGTKRA